jgi:hypothetical protein
MFQVEQVEKCQKNMKEIFSVFFHGHLLCISKVPTNKMSYNFSKYKCVKSTLQKSTNLVIPSIIFNRYLFQILYIFMITCPQSYDQVRHYYFAITFNI